MGSFPYPPGLSLRNCLARRKRAGMASFPYLLVKFPYPVTAEKGGTEWMNPDLERHELHELARILTLIRANSRNSCPSGPCLSVIRGQPLLAKLDDLTHRTLGATM